VEELREHMRSHEHTPVTYLVTWSLSMFLERTPVTYLVTWSLSMFLARILFFSLLSLGRSHMETPGSADPDDFFKISDKLLFIMKPIPTAFLAGFTPAFHNTLIFSSLLCGCRGHQLLHPRLHRV
jgi:hypothetical protein